MALWYLLFNACLLSMHPVFKDCKRVLEYGVRAPVFHGNLREQTGGNGFPRTPTGITPTLD